MEALGLALLMVAIMFALVALGIPIAYALLLAGGIGYSIIAGPLAMIAQTGVIAWEFGHNPIFAAIPLFLLMGQIVFRAGFGKDFFDAVYVTAARLPGRVGVTAVWSCVGFGSVTGSSFAAIATMGSVAMPEMRRLGYSGAAASGVLASASTLAILVPPSVTLIFYGAMTETSVGALFIAGLLPAVLLGIIFSAWIMLRTGRTEQPPSDALTPGRAVRAPLGRVAPLVVTFIAILGGIYFGLVSPADAAALGVAVVAIQAMVLRRLTVRQLFAAAYDATLVAGSIFAIVIGGSLLTRFLAQTGLAQRIAGLVSDSSDPQLVMLAIMVIYLVLGALLDALSMLVLTLPLLLPIVLVIGFDPVWFGVFVVLMTELALITPPMGMNVFVLHRVAPDISLAQMFRGVLPFIAMLIIFAVFMIFFPEVILWLPQTLS